MGNVVNAANDLFSNKGLRKVLVKFSIPLTVVMLGLLVWMMYAFTKPTYFYIGLVISIIGSILQWWCFSCIKTSTVLAVNGPYMFVRNPMYLARFFQYLGVMVMTGFWGCVVLVPLYIIFYWFYMANRVKREEKKLKPIFGQPYEDFLAAVPRFLPAFKPYPGGKLFFFDMENFKRNSGPFSIVFMTALYIVLWAVVIIAIPALKSRLS